MAKAKKLKSGSWNIMVFSHLENGKRKYESFTAPTKAEVELKAAEFKAEKKRRKWKDLTVLEAVDGYIRAKENVLSPETIRGYIKIRENNLDGIQQKKIKNLTSEDLQIFISELAVEKSPKTVRNVYGLIRAAIAMYAPDLAFKVTMPAKKKSRPESPSDDDVRLLWELASPQMRVRLALAACGLRRGELCAVKYEDIKGDMLHVHADIVQDKKNKWIYKEIPKTSESDRYIKLPSTVLELIGEGSGFIVKVHPPAVTAGFIRLRNKAGVKSRLHDMRHFFSSTAAILGIPDIYTADMGGWERGSVTMKRVYQNNIRSMSDYYQDKMSDHLNKIMGGA